MGLRSRLRARVGRAWEGLAARFALSGPIEERWGRTPAWPPERIGDDEVAGAPQLHPLDRVRIGLPTIPPSEAVAAAPAPAADDDDGFDFDLPWGGVAQDPYLPPPPAPAPRPQAAQAPPVPAQVAKAPTAEPPGEPADVAEVASLRDAVVAVLHTIYDPEIPVDIYALGLVYDVDVKPSRDVEIRMTLTSPNCPAAQSLPGEVEQKSASVDGIRSAMVDVVWDPPWSPSMMSEEAKLELNIDG